jgi:hypothetical protein
VPAATAQRPFAAVKVRSGHRSLHPYRLHVKESLKNDVTFLKTNAFRLAAGAKTRNIQICLDFAPYRPGASTPKIANIFFLES